MGMEARPGVGDLLRLGGRLGGGWLRRRRDADPGGEVCRWASEVMEREDAGGLRLGVGAKSIHLVGDPERSEAILGAVPGEDGWKVSPLKADAMGFLAPGALTVADGDGWAPLRAFNERVLGTGAVHDLAPTFLLRVREAFERPVRDAADVRDAMGRAMVSIVLGPPGPGHDPAGDVSALFDLVQSPVRRKLLGFLHHDRRERLYALLERLWEASGPEDATLLGRAHAAADGMAKDAVLQQVPHWMFTFTGSGSDLLARTLALVGSRPAVRARVVEEAAAAGPPDRAETVGRLTYLEACVHETGRLFPPVTRTFHWGPLGTGNGEPSHVVHWFPLLQRAGRLDASVHDFEPERWLGDAPDAAARASNLFLRGPRTCPGTSLILFVCRAALARQIGELGVTARVPSRLSRDPLPVSFPERAARFTSEGTS